MFVVIVQRFCEIGQPETYTVVYGPYEEPKAQEMTAEIDCEDNEDLYSVEYFRLMKGG